MFFSFLKSTAPRPEESSPINQKGNTNSPSLRHSSWGSLLFEVKPLEASQRFLLKDCEMMR